MKAYLVIAHWPNGTEGLLFPRPGNVPIADTLEKGMDDFQTASRHLEDMLKDPIAKQRLLGTSLSLVEFERKTVLLSATPR